MALQYEDLNLFAYNNSGFPTPTLETYYTHIAFKSKECMYNWGHCWICLWRTAGFGVVQIIFVFNGDSRRLGDITLISHLNRPGTSYKKNTRSCIWLVTTWILLLSGKLAMKAYKQSWLYSISLSLLTLTKSGSYYRGGVKRVNFSEGDISRQNATRVTWQMSNACSRLRFFLDAVLNQISGNKKGFPWFKDW